MKQRITAILIFFVLLSFSACMGQPGTSESITKPVLAVYPEGINSNDTDARIKLRDDNPVDDRFLASVNGFSYQTAQALLADQKDNFNYSPLSLYFALALTGSGADGETKQQILDLLGVSSEKKLSEQCGNLYRLLYSDQEISKLKIANSLWLDTDARLKKSFTQNAAGNFYASVFPIDFADPSSLERMSKWIADNTNGTIQPKFPPNPGQILSVINTVYFYDEWTYQFAKNETAADVFHAAKGDVTVDYMNRRSPSDGYVKGDHFTRSSLYLKGGSEMVFILPDQGTTVSELLSSDGAMEKLFTGGKRHSGEVIWKIPKFKFDSGTELSDSLERLGMTEAFQPEADFSGITDDMASLSSIIQQTHIAIDENGVEASAFTKIDLFGMALPDGRAEMVLDRPFLYGILSPQGTPLFIGICNDPSED